MRGEKTLKAVAKGSVCAPYLQLSWNEDCTPTLLISTFGTGPQSGTKTENITMLMSTLKKEAGWICKQQNQCNAADRIRYLFLARFHWNYLYDLFQVWGNPSRQGAAQSPFNKQFKSLNPYADPPWQMWRSSVIGWGLHNCHSVFSYLRLFVLFCFKSISFVIIPNFFGFCWKGGQKKQNSTE